MRKSLQKPQVPRRPTAPWQQYVNFSLFRPWGFRISALWVSESVGVHLPAALDASAFKIENPQQKATTLSPPHTPCMHMRHIHTYTHTHIHTYVQTYVRKYIRIYMCLSMYTHVYIYIFTHAHTHTHTHIHTYLHAYNRHIFLKA